jgi:hypothetical protein
MIESRLRLRLEAAERECRELRRAWCLSYTGPLAYMDDGEAQDSRVFPCIDFLRDSVPQILEKMRQRSKSAAADQ